MDLKLLDIISLITVFHLLLLSITLFNHDKGKRISNRILAMFLASNAMMVSKITLSRFEILPSAVAPYVFYLVFSFYFLIGPMLYFYTRSLCYSDFMFKKKHLLHTIPYILFTVLSIIHVYMITHQLNQDSTFLSRLFIKDFRFYYNSILHIQVLSYIIATLNTFRIYRKKLKTFYSSVEKINLSWMKFLLLIFIFHWLMDVFHATIRFLHIDARHLPEVIRTSSISVLLIFATILVYKGLKQLKIFSGIEEKHKYATSNLKRSNYEEYIKRLKDCMEKQKPYLNPLLTVDDLARKLSIPIKHLSQTINDVLNQNFFDFINSYRIEEAKQILSDPKNRHNTILEVLYNAGFNSKSVFNSAFKKYTGMTPSDFRKKQID